MRSLIAKSGICAVALAAAALGGCATPGETGAVAGAVVGGVAGSAITGGSTAGTVVGAGAGALIGNRIARDHYYNRGSY